MTQCGTMYGGRHRKGHNGKRTRKMRGGVMYGPTTAITPGALEWGAVDTSAPVSSATGAPVTDPFKTSPDTNAKVTGGRRSRKGKGKGKKTNKKTKKAGRRHRKMKGGAGVYNSGAVRAEFVGNPGVNGPLTYGQYVGSPSKVGPGPTFGADGVAKLS